MKLPHKKPVKVIGLLKTGKIQKEKNPKEFKSLFLYRRRKVCLSIQVSIEHGGIGGKRIWNLIL
jgi:hypothetical protein